MISFLKPRNIRQMGHRGWAAVFFGESAVELTTSRSTAGNDVGVQNQASAPLGAVGGSMDAKSRWQAAVQGLRGRIHPNEHRIVTAIGCEDVLCQTLLLPTTQSSELQQMLELQIDNLTPLPLEEAVYSFEPLGKTENETRVLVAIARKAAVNERVAVLEESGLPPEVVGIDALAVFHSFVRGNLVPLDGKLNALVQVSPAAVHVVVHSQGLPVTIRSLVLGESLMGSDVSRAALREELQRTLVAAEAEQPGRVIGKMTIATWSDKLRAEVEDLGKAWTGEVQCYTNGSAPTPAVSLCTETAAAEGARMNLLPDEWRVRRRTAQLRLRLIRGGIALAVAYVLVLSAFLVFLGIHEARLSRVKTEIKNRQKPYDDARQLHSLLVTMQKQLDMKYSTLEVMREVCQLMPETVKLNGFSFKKDDAVTLKAQAQAATVATEFISKLEQSALFSKISPGNMRTDPSAGGLTKFDVVCTLKSAATVPATGRAPWH